MNCHLCDQAIAGYSPAFHLLKADETRAFDICPACIDKFVQWQGRVIGKLFPTKALKKRFEQR